MEDFTIKTLGDDFDDDFEKTSMTKEEIEEFDAEMEYYAKEVERCELEQKYWKALDFLRTVLGGNLNISTLTPIAIVEIMEDYVKHYKYETKWQKKI